MADKNINQIIKNNQRYLWGIIVTVISLGVAGIYGINKLINHSKDDVIEFEEEEKTLEPDLTGAIANTFDGKVSSQVITDAQAESKENREALRKVLDEIKSIKEESKKEREEVKKKLEEITKTQDVLFDEMNTLRDGAIVEPSSEKDNYSISAKREKIDYSTGTSKNNFSHNNGVISLSEPYSSQVKKNSTIQRKVYSSKKSMGGNDKKFYIPAGAFSAAIILEGADASAAVTASKNAVSPMQVKLTGDLHLPNNKRNKKLQGCFVTAGAYGDISSERAIVRLERLSCVINGKHIDQLVKGHIAFYGKNGIKGIPVMRNGKMLGLAFLSGALGGVGNAVSQIGNTQAGLGAARTVGADEVLRQSAGGGVSTAANKLADYYIQLAEQYHPVIPIGAANRVEVIFQEGFWAEFLEDKEEDIQVKSEPITQQPTNNSLQGLPADLQRQLGEVKYQSLSDFVTPNQK